MGVQAVEPRRAGGVTTAFNAVASPNEAFETLRVAPMWGWAFVIAAVLAIAGTLLAFPASHHTSVVAMQKMLAGPIMSSLTPEQKQQQLARANQVTPATYAFSIGGVLVLLLFMAFFNALILLIFNAAGKGKGDFKRLWCGSMNIAVPTIGIQYIVSGIIAVIRGPLAYNSSMDIVRSIPSLAMLAPHAAGALAGFLASISIFTLWGLFLNAAMMQTLARTSKGLAYAGAITIIVLGALLGAAFGQAARAFGMG